MVFPMKKAGLVLLFALAAACSSPDEGTTVKPGRTKATAPAGADAGATSTSVPAAGGPNRTGAATEPGQPGTPTGDQATTTTAAGAGGQVTTTTAASGVGTPKRIPDSDEIVDHGNGTTTTGPPDEHGCVEVEYGGYKCGTLSTR